MLIVTAVGAFSVGAAAYLWFTRNKSVDRDGWRDEAADYGRDFGDGGGGCGGGGD